MYLHLPDLTDTISYALGPGNAKKFMQKRHYAVHTSNLKKKKNHEFGDETALDGSI